MKKFLINLILYLLPLVVVLVSGDIIITSGLQKTNHDTFKSWNDIYNGKIKSNVIINGSSRAMVQVSTEILDSVLNVNSYNLGTNSLFFNLQYAKYNEFERYNMPPDIVIQTLDMFTLQTRSSLPEPLQFLPYFFKIKLRRTIMEYKEGFNLSEYYIPSLRYINNTDIAEIGLKEIFNLKSYQSKKIKGYQPTKRKWDGSFEKFKKKYPKGIRRPLDDTTIQLFDKFLSKCKTDSMTVFLVYTPEFTEGHAMTKNRDEIIKTYRNFSEKYDFPFFDYSQNFISQDKSLFYNSQHLKAKGAAIFSKVLAEDIKKWLAENSENLISKNKILTEKK
ncbi:MAG: hypothetical protein U9N85_01870 [Bacteroidota bacterium]|nr:hypothetical protein [Bacteroidota bacterium]